MTKFLLLCGFFLLLVGSPVQASLPVLRLGVDSSLQDSFYSDSLWALQKKLEEDFQPILVRLPEDKLEEAARSGELDLLLASATTYRKLLRVGSRDLAAEVSAWGNNPSRVSGATVIVLSARTDLTRWWHLHGKKIAFLAPFKTAGTAFLWDDMVQTGVVPQSERMDFLFQDAELPDLDTLLRHLRSGTADAIVLPTCFLENQTASREWDTADLRVLEPHQDMALACAQSSRLVPGATWVGLPSLRNDLPALIMRTLLELSPANGRFWDIAADYSVTDEILRESDLDAWAEERKISWRKILHEYRWPLFSLLFALCGLLTHGFLVQWLVRRRTAQLEKALHEQRRLSQQVQETTDRLETLRKIGLLGQFASLFAHELRQPLNAIVCYTHGLKHYAAELPQARHLLQGLDAIDRQTVQAAQIVARVREYIQSRKRRENLSLSAVIRKAVTSFQTTRLGAMRIHANVDPALTVSADPLEMELVFVNLLRNAAEAQREKSQPQAWIAAQREADGTFTTVRVWDGGPALSVAEVEHIISIGTTSKPEGLGLGLGIVRTLVENNGGTMRILQHQDKTAASPSPQGLEIAMRFPVTEAKSHE